MPKGGTVSIHLSPADADVVARWLKSIPAPLWGVPLRNVPMLANGVSASVVQQFEAFAKRKRKTGRHALAGIELCRSDAEWLASKVHRGMFGSSNQRFLPAPVAEICRSCSTALAKRKGAPKYRAGSLDAAITRQKRNVSDPCTPVGARWLKRLRKRKRQDDAFAQVMKGAKGLWLDWQPKNSP